MRQTPAQRKALNNGSNLRGIMGSVGLLRTVRHNISAECNYLRMYPPEEVGTREQLIALIVALDDCITALEAVESDFRSYRKTEK